MAGMTEIAKNIAEEVGGVKASKVTEILEQFQKEVVSTCDSGDKVIMKGFGTFSRKEKAARDGRNPANGESVKIAAKNVLHFKPAKDILEQPKAKKAKK